ncbi:MAG: hypothetical protein ACKOFI_01460 [Phycisphaerales bacterium]
MTVARRAAPAVLALAALVGPGCQQDLRRDAAAIDRAFAAGNYAQARSLAEDACERKGDDQQDRLVWWLAAGRTSQADMAIPESVQWYGKAYEAVRPYLDTKAEATVSEAVVTTAVNQTMRALATSPSQR